MIEQDVLERGRRAYAESGWLNAFALLSRADAEDRLAPRDLELVARSAYMLGKDDEYVAALERAHQQYLENGEVPPAVRCGFWIGHSFLFRGERARATGWFARSQRLLEAYGGDCVERGYLLIPLWLEQMGGRNFADGLATTVEAATIAERFGDRDLVWLARDEQARALLGMGRVKEGLRLVDEALAAAAANELSPIVTGIVYCNTIAFCRSVYDVRHVREWTRALTDWCDRQPEMIAHNGLCLVHRAEIKLLGGDWGGALLLARDSAERFSRGALNRLAGGHAWYCQGEIHRLRGEFDAADDAFREANRQGCEPQPGLARMRLAQGNVEAAAAALRRFVGETTVPLRRAGVLPAYVEVMLTIGSLDLARAACSELEETAHQFESEELSARASHARGLLLLADRRPTDALIELRRALSVWLELEAAYEIARVRVSIAQACQALADYETASLELEIARRIFRELGAGPDEARVASLARVERETTRGDAHGLTDRELEVLQLLAGGHSNRDIAQRLFISEHTVARHVQNIFAKLAVSSRAGATAFAFSHQLI